MRQAICRAQRRRSGIIHKPHHKPDAFPEAAIPSAQRHAGVGERGTNRNHHLTKGGGMKLFKKEWFQEMTFVVVFGVLAGIHNMLIAGKEIWWVIQGVAMISGAAMWWLFTWRGWKQIMPNKTGRTELTALVYLCIAISIGVTAGLGIPRLAPFTLWANMLLFWGFVILIIGSRIADRRKPTLTSPQ